MDFTPEVEDIPNLPEPEPGMTWRDLNAFPPHDRGEAFYLTCLQYALHLWRQNLPARAILCLDRAWGADLNGAEAVLRKWPLPYGPLLHILQKAPDGVFLGNPRVHFQHYADRLGPPRQEQRKWRSWACWAITCAARHDLPGDPRHNVQEPPLDLIAQQLDQHGHPGETALWRSVLHQAQSNPLP